MTDSLQNMNIYDMNVYVILRNQGESRRYIIGMTIEQAEDIIYVLQTQRSALHLLNVDSFGRRRRKLNKVITTNDSSDDDELFVGKLDGQASRMKRWKPPNIPLINIK